MATERHHILFNKRAWSSYEEGRSLRESPSLIVPLESDIHRELHRNVPIVPLLGYYSLSSVAAGYEPDYKPLKDISQLQSLIERTKTHPRAHGIEKGLADLAIHALDLQRPFLIASGAHEF